MLPLATGGESMGHRAIVAILAVALAIPSPARALTWQDVRGICLEDQEACWFYILGAIDAVSNIHRDRICIPANVSHDTAVIVVDAYAMQFPALWPELQSFEVVTAALLATYPCRPGV